MQLTPGHYMKRRIINAYSYKHVGQAVGRRGRKQRRIGTDKLPANLPFPTLSSLVIEQTHSSGHAPENYTGGHRNDSLHNPLREEEKYSLLKHQICVNDLQH